MILTLYIMFGIWAFFYEWSQGSSKKFALFIAIFYPITICMGIIGWIILGIYHLTTLIIKTLTNLSTRSLSK